MIRALRSATIALAFLLAACAPTAAPVASGPEKVSINADTAAELKAVIIARETALQNKDLKGFQATIDLTRAAFRRCQSETFDIASRQGFTPTAVLIGKVEPYLDAYVRAYVGNTLNLSYSRNYFRKEAGKWILSEPLDSELGGDQTKTIDGLQLSYYGIDSDVIDRYAASGNDARLFLAKTAQGHTATATGFGLRIFPTRGAAGPNVGCGVAGFHLTNNPSDPFIRLFSNALTFELDLSRVTDSTASIIRHEGLHWLQDQFIPGISARMPFWLVEGWPDFIGQSRSTSANKFVLCTTPTPTFKQLEDGVLQTPETPPELPGQYYSFANTMVEYAYKIGGPNAYWDLMTAYKAGVDAKVNLPLVLHLTPEAFYSAWLTWAKQTYC